MLNVFSAAGRERRDQARVHAAREQHADRHVGGQVRADGARQPLADLLRQLVQRLATQLAGRQRARPRVALDLTRPPSATSRCPGSSLRAARKIVAGAGTAFERQVGLDRLGVDVAREARQREQRLQLGREGQPALDDAVDERLDPERVARQHEPPAAHVPQRQGEHPAQPFDERRPALLVEVHEHLDVRAGAERMAAALQLTTQRAMVVELAVADHEHRAVLVGQRLIAVGGVDQREPADRQPGDVVEVVPGAVRPAVRERGGHRGQLGGAPAARRPAGRADPRSRTSARPPGLEAARPGEPRVARRARR